MFVGVLIALDSDWLENSLVGHSNAILGAVLCKKKSHFFHTCAILDLHLFWCEINGKNLENINIILIFIEMKYDGSLVLQILLENPFTM